MMNYALSTRWRTVWKNHVKMIDVTISSASIAESFSLGHQHYTTTTITNNEGKTRKKNAPTEPITICTCRPMSILSTIYPTQSYGLTKKRREDCFFSLHLPSLLGLPLLCATTEWTKCTTILSPALLVVEKCVQTKRHRFHLFNQRIAGVIYKTGCYLVVLLPCIVPMMIHHFVLSTNCTLHQQQQQQQ